jgi:hypothetical protein
VKFDDEFKNDTAPAEGCCVVLGLVVICLFLVWLVTLVLR